MAKFPKASALIHTRAIYSGDNLDQAPPSCHPMNQKLYTLAVGHSDYPAAEIFTSERAALQRNLELSDVSESQRDQLLHLSVPEIGTPTTKLLVASNPK